MAFLRLLKIILQTFINTINELTDRLGTVMLIRASSQFEELSIGIQKETDEVNIKSDKTVLPEIRAKKNDVLEKEVQYYNSKVEEIYTEFVKEFTNDIFASNLTLLSDYKDEAHKRYNQLEKKIDQFDGSEEKRRLLISTRNDLVYHLNNEVDEVLNEQEKIKDLFDSNLSLVGVRLKKFIEEIPEKIPVYFDLDDLLINKTDKLFERFNKRYKKLKYSITKSKISKQLKIGKFCSYYFDKLYAEAFTTYLGECETLNYKILSELQNSHASVLSSLDGILNKIDKKEDPSVLISAEKEKFDALFERQIEFAKSNFSNSTNNLFLSIRNEFQNLLNDLENISANSILRHSRKLNNTDKIQIHKVSDLPKIWTDNTKRILNLIEADLLTENFKGKVLSHISSIKINVSRDLNTYYFNKAAKLGNEIQNNIDTSDKSQKNKLDIKFDDSFNLLDLFEPSIEKIREDIIEFPESIEIITEKSSENEVRNNFEESESLNINLRKLIDYNIESQLIEKLYLKINETQKELLKSTESLKSIIGLLNFNLQNIESPLPSDLNSDQTIQQAQKNSLQKIEQEVLSVSEIKTKFLNSIDDIFQKSFEPLTSYRLIKSSLELGKSG